MYRLIYSIGFQANIGQQRPLYPQILDINDLGSPSDANYNAFLNQYLTVLNRSNLTALNLFDSNKISQIDTVVGVIIYIFELSTNWNNLMFF